MSKISYKFKDYVNMYNATEGEIVADTNVLLSYAFLSWLNSRGKEIHVPKTVEKEYFHHSGGLVTGLKLTRDIYADSQMLRNRRFNEVLAQACRISPTDASIITYAIFLAEKTDKDVYIFSNDKLLTKCVEDLKKSSYLFRNEMLKKGIPLTREVLDKLHIL